MDLTIEEFESLDKAIEWVGQMQAQGKPTNLRLEFDEQSVLQPAGEYLIQPKVSLLMEAIQAASNVHVSSLSLKGFNNMAAMQRLQAYLMVQLPTLTSISFWRNTMQNISMLLSQCHALTFLECSEVTFDGSVNEFREFAAVLEANPKLRVVELAEDCKILKHSVSHISPVLTALSTLDNLYSLDIEHWSSPAVLDVRGMTSLDHLFIDAQVFSTSFETIQSSGNITQLIIQNLSLPDSEVWKKLGQLVRNNRVLEHLCVDAHNITEAGLIDVLQALKENSSISSFAVYLFGDPVLSDKAQAAIVSMMEANFNLWSVSFGHRTVSESTTDSIQLYGNLNWRGCRKQFVHFSTSRAHQVKTMSLVNDDVRALFHLLSLKPCLCNLMCSSGKKRS